ncbi:MAG TPA: ImmA/IrrE family metallo-endopeptidase [Clostridiales bacterium]|nr:ImmA/IrrE family metallo-endopeptidase [Clostridiales bacterium]
MGKFSLEQGLSPEWYAKSLLNKLNIKAPPIIAKDVARELGIKYREDDLENEKVDGALYRRGDKTLIAINSQIKYEERKNFSGAHEIGHFIIESHNAESYSCSKSDMEIYGSIKKVVEAEANRFAAALLMPDVFVVKAIKGETFSFDAIQRITETFKVSLSAAALRFVEFTDEKCAVVFSQNGEINWSQSSKSFRYSLRRGKLLDITYAYDAFHGNDPLSEKFEKVYPHAWIADADVPNDLNVQEFSCYFKNINSVLSLVKVEEDEDDDWVDEDQY